MVYTITQHGSGSRQVVYTMVYSIVYTGFYGMYRDIYLFFCIYRDIFNPQCIYIVCLLTFPGVHRAQTRKFTLPTVSEDGETQESQASRDDMSECSARDWEDYNYAPPAGSAGGRQGAGRSDPLANLCDGLPVLAAADIAALLRDFPIPTPGDVPGTTVEESIEV